MSILKPLFPVRETEDQDCQEHNCPRPCAKCEADADWKARHDYARSLELQADAIESMTLSDQADREHLRVFANDLRKRASRIMGELGRIADQQARDEENARNTWHRSASA